MPTSLHISIVLTFSTLVIACSRNEQAPDTHAQMATQEDFVTQGREIAGTTFTTLSANLTKALNAGGVTEAVRYCNLAADPLVDSLSRAHNATIRRTSTKFRNPKNAPTPEEQRILNVYAQQLKAGQSPEPVIEQGDSQQVQFYAPIYVNALCLQCHGVPGETMRDEDAAVIRALYPEDQATGYKEGDFRGIWSITFVSN